MHASGLLAQLDRIRAQVEARTDSERDELASREILAIRALPETDLTPEQLDDSKQAWLVGVVGETGTLLVDASDGELGYLRKKIEAFDDDAKVKQKTSKDGTPKLDERGNPLTARASEKAIAPIEVVKLAELDDVAGPRLRKDPLQPGQPRWLELTCRGGYRRDAALTATTQSQMARQLHALGALPSGLEAFSGPEHVYYFLRLERDQVVGLIRATDCIYEVELAPPDIRDMKLVEEVARVDLASVAVAPPPADAPSVVVMDTGIATEHPLLKPALLPPATAAPEIPGVEDVHGHGTQMAGIALHADLGSTIERGSTVANHWIQASRLLVRPHGGTASDANSDWWPKLTEGAVRAAEQQDPAKRRRVFLMAVTRSMQEPPFDEPEPTLWSHAADVITYGKGRGRLLVVSAGNARPQQWLTLADGYPQLQLAEKIHEPAQAANVLTVGAFTSRTSLPPGPDHREYRVVAAAGGISPFTSCGPVGPKWPVKPDVVLEGGNLARTDVLYDSGVETLSALTTQRTQIGRRPLTTINMTSEASARAARLAARIWTAEPKLRPETVRGLIVHSASWTDTMLQQFPVVSDRLLACGYGVPNERLASECAQGVATILVEDSLPNAVAEEVPKETDPARPDLKSSTKKLRRKVKLFRVPIPESLMTDEDPDVELRVTLSYFAEPNKFGRSVYRGLDLKWRMQGPQETEDEFLQRINVLKRPKGKDGKRIKPEAVGRGFNWDVGVQMRSRGTVQSDRWRGKMSALVGDKLIAIVPVLGWWDQRNELKSLEVPFSLVVSMVGPGVYAAIKPRVEAQTLVAVEV